jgi:rhamnogalacturonyl hydrolase YesR
MADELRFDQTRKGNSMFTAGDCCLGPSQTPMSSIRLCLVFALGLLLTVPLVRAQMTKSEGNPWVGNSLETPLPLAHDLSAELKKKDVARAIQKVADWQLKTAQPGFDQDWTFATLYAGFMAVPNEANGKKYQDAMLEVGKKFHWQLGPRLGHADDEAIGQTYLDLSRIYHDPAMMAPTRERIEAAMKIPDNPEKPLWWWCDALFMAPPLLAKLSRDTGDRRYLDFMDHEWWITSKALYSPDDHLYFRDDSYINSREANGRKVFWSRGNGWVFAGLASVLSEMPADYPTRPRYVAQFRELAEKIASLQQEDGLWRAGLLDEDAYKLPENSGSAFFAYGFAYGVNAGILDRDQYRPVVERAWKGLLAHVYEDGRLGSIQPVGAAPGAFGPTSSYVFGTGALLLAGSEVYRLSQ